MKKYIFLVGILFVSNVGLAKDSIKVEVNNPEVYKQQIQAEDVQPVDVHSPQEFRAGHVAGAENVDFLAEGFLPKFEKFDKTKTLYLYCRSGNRSSKAAAKLSEKGFLHTVELKGGYKAWTAEK